MNVTGTQAISLHPPGPARRAGIVAAPIGGGGVHNAGVILLQLRLLGANVVDDAELSVPRGSAFGYLGPNGAGKTTLIRTLLGLTRADGGTMSLFGTPVPAQRKRSRALARVGLAGIAAGTARTDTGLTVTLPAGASRELIAGINRRLVRADVDVYGLLETRASLADWFLSVTSRLGDPS